MNNTIGLDPDHYGGVDNLNTQLKYSNTSSITSVQDNLNNLRQLTEYINGKRKEVPEVAVRALLNTDNYSVGSIENLQKLLEGHTTNLNTLQNRIKSFAKILDFTNSKLNSKEPTLQEYIDVGFNVAHVDIDALNSLVKNKNITNFNELKDQLENVAAAWKVIQEYSKSEGKTTPPSKDDYNAIGLDHVC